MPRKHKSLPRLFVSPDLHAGGAITLDRDQSNYLANVLRRKVGDEVVLFNGRDGAWRCVLAQVAKRSVTADPVEQIAPQSAPNDLWYGFAPLKSARLDYVVQKATEMGVSAIQPVKTQHTQLARVKTERMAANAIEAAEQCEVLNVPEILPQTDLASLLQTWPEAHAGRTLILADESLSSATPIETLAEVRGKPLGLLIGPEGGFSESELEQLRAKSFVLPISLGPRILRADTAAVAALAVIQSIIGDWR